MLVCLSVKLTWVSTLFHLSQTYLLVSSLISVISVPWLISTLLATSLVPSFSLTSLSCDLTSLTNPTYAGVGVLLSLCPDSKHRVQLPSSHKSCLFGSKLLSFIKYCSEKFFSSCDSHTSSAVFSSFTVCLSVWEIKAEWKEIKDYKRNNPHSGWITSTKYNIRITN